MNETLYHTCLVICLGLLMFTLAISYLHSTGEFETPGTKGQEIGDTSEALSHTTDLEEPNMNWLWGAVAIGLAAGVLAGAGSHLIGASVNATVVAGVSIFASIFWASFIKTHEVLSTNFLDPAIMTVFTILACFVFIGAAVGMLTGVG